MKYGRSLLMAGTATLALTGTAVAQGTASSSQMAACGNIRNEMETEVNQINKGGTWKTQFDRLMQQARQARDPANCLDTLQRANRLVARETGDQPIGSDRFRMARAASGVPGSAKVGSSSASSSTQDRTSAADLQSYQSSMVDESAKRVYVAFADEIVGATAIDTTGEEAGEIEYLVIDTVNGKIKFAVLASGGVLDIGEELAAVPWEQITVRMNRGQPSVELTGTAAMIKEGQRLRRDELEQLTNINYQTQVIQYWVPTTTSDKTETSQRSGGTASQAQGLQDKANSPSENAQQSRQRTTAGNQKQSRQVPAGQVGRAESRDAEGDTLMLAGREFITVLMPSSLKTGRQLRGATVESSDGQELGEIDRLVLDTNRGYVAYALVAQGGFLGIGEEWRPVPLTALKWRSGETYALSASVDELQSRPRLTSSDLPDRIRTADLRKLYDAYQAQRYWTSDPSAREGTAATGGSSGESGPQR